ncbi:MAG: nucleoside-triphosphatase [Oscillospiraceae bacterium]|jgi:nucleoside-triphosphatase|nr:nucleoside-triphosphatase [Oscillospiraceae bacterium]
MHLFLTGEIQIGKSTALRRWLDYKKLKTDGFLTFFEERNTNSRRLIMSDTTRLRQAELAVFRDNAFEINLDTFEKFGLKLLQNSGKYDVIVMDELGTMEENAPNFKQAVLTLLDGNFPIVGVVKQRDSPFLDAVRTHPLVQLITVTTNNRDDYRQWTL